MRRGELTDREAVRTAVYTAPATMAFIFGVGELDRMTSKKVKSKDAYRFVGALFFSCGAVGGLLYLNGATWSLRPHLCPPHHPVDPRAPRTESVRLVGLFDLHFRPLSRTVRPGS